MIEFIIGLGVFIFGWGAISIVFSLFTGLTFQISSVVGLIVILLFGGLIKGNINLNLNR